MVLRLNIPRLLLDLSLSPVPPSRGPNRRGLLSRGRVGSKDSRNRAMLRGLEFRGRAVIRRGILRLDKFTGRAGGLIRVVFIRMPGGSGRSFRTRHTRCIPCLEALGICRSGWRSTAICLSISRSGFCVRSLVSIG